jgi:hypothetical protein
MNITLTLSSRAIYNCARSPIKSQKRRRFSDSLADGERIPENVVNICYRTDRIPVPFPIRRQ